MSTTVVVGVGVACALVVCWLDVLGLHAGVMLFTGCAFVIGVASMIGGVLCVRGAGYGAGIVTFCFGAVFVVRAAVRAT